MPVQHFDVEGSIRLSSQATTATQEAIRQRKGSQNGSSRFQEPLSTLFNTPPQAPKNARKTRGLNTPVPWQGLVGEPCSTPFSLLHRLKRKEASHGIRD
jgi:hypothetical protein